MTFFERLHAKLRRETHVGIDRTIVYRRLRDDGPVAPACDDLDVRVLDASEMHRLCALGPFDVEEGERRFARGDQCFGAWLGGDLAHYSWAQHTGSHAISSAGLEVPIPDGSFWIYNCRTAETYRGRRIYPRALARIAADAFARGCAAAWIYAAESNVASHRGIERAGFQPVATLRAVRLGRFTRALGRDALFATRAA